MTFAVQVAGVADGRVEVIEDGEPLDTASLGAENKRGSFSVRGDGRRHWLRINVRSSQGKLLLVGNPIYLNF